MHEADIVAAANESLHARDAALLLMEEYGVFAVNPALAAQRARMKPIQLVVAERVGFSIPETIISNSSRNINKFCGDGSGTIIKSLTAPVWADGVHTYSPLTTTVGQDLLDNEASLRAAPAIYQEKVQKAFEVRTLVMGGTTLSVMIDSQVSDASMADWRGLSTADQNVQRHILPRDVEDKCVQLVRGLGICTGSIDMIVGPSGDYTFLEVNEMGQFLWMERDCEDLPVLDAFASFLTSRDSDFRWSGTAAVGVSFTEFWESGHAQRSYELEQANSAPFDFSEGRVFVEAQS